MIPFFFPFRYMVNGDVCSPGGVDSSEGIKAETNSRRVSFNGSLNMQSLWQFYSFLGLCLIDK